MDKDIPKIKCDTTHTFRSISTNKTYSTKEEFLQHHEEQDLAIDTAVMVTNEGLELLEKIMGQK